MPGRAVLARPRLRATPEGWRASGPGFYLWQEDRPSARAWLDALTATRTGPVHSRRRR